MFIKSKIQFFESKSQHHYWHQYKPISCLSSQRYNFLKANHNRKQHCCSTCTVVYQVKDTIFWKQITTAMCRTIRKAKLFIKSKIQFFESKSQPEMRCKTSTTGCLSSQRYNFLKANHNSLLSGTCFAIVVYQVKDTIFWKQITTPIIGTALTPALFIKSKIQFFESKSQPKFWLVFHILSCLSSQRYNFLKANHNKTFGSWQLEIVVYQVKDTIFWKQITTWFSYKILFACCLSSQRYNFLKANHNIQVDFSNRICVVYQVKDTIFWKQITTSLTIQKSHYLLFIKSKIQFFESKSQQLKQCV